MIQPPWKTVQSYLRKLNIELLYDPAIPLLGMYSDKAFIEKATSTPMFTAALFTIAKIRKQPKCPSTLGLRRCGAYMQWTTNSHKKRTK